MSAQSNKLKLRGADLAWREVDTEIIVLDLRTSRYLSINRTGMVLWKHLADGATSADLAARLIEEFEISRETAERDVDSFLQMCSDRNLLEPVG